MITFGILAIYMLSPLEYFLKLGDLGTISKLVGIVVSLLFCINMLMLNKPSLLISRESYILMAFIFLGFSSILWAYDIRIVIARTITLVQLFILYLITLNVIQNNNYITRNLYNIIIIYGVILSSYMLWQVCRLGSLSQWLRISISENYDVNHLASFLIPPFIFSLYYTHTKSFAYSITSIIILLAILMTQSRGAVLSIVFTIVLYIFFIEKKITNKFKIGLITVIILATSLLLIPDVFTYRLQLIFYDTSELFRGSGRNIIWGNAIREFINKPLTGIGLGNFTILYRPPHSSFFQVLSELGILGIAIMSVFVFYLLKYKVTKRVISIEQLVVICLFAMSLTVDIFYQKYLWIILGLLSGAKRKYYQTTYTYIRKRTRLYSHYNYQMAKYNKKNKKFIMH